MTSLTEFLLARIAEDETVALAAAADDGGSNEGFANQYDRLVGTHGRPLDFTPRFGEDAARLIVRYAVPARVLAECEAKRRIMDLHAAVPVAQLHACLECERAHPCPTMLAVCKPYADHADFQDEWRV